VLVFCREKERRLQRTDGRQDRRGACTSNSRTGQSHTAHGFVPVFLRSKSATQRTKEVKKQNNATNLFGIELNAALGEPESFLDKRCQFADPSALLAKDLLGVCGADDDLGAGVGDADLAARVSLARQLALEELGELGAKKRRKGHSARVDDASRRLKGLTRKHRRLQTSCV
jgi:hypothetical protein